ncbi:hypothetical protein [Streptomyces hawaiiensis]|uniref:hypothetical protein n=1 Tax=Streptomyces hawaiiensis TaxID=67305 RepID=UPI001585EE76|nr:hypothetical protein [Streptomyces hawaiiensis]
MTGRLPAVAQRSRPVGDHRADVDAVLTAEDSDEEDRRIAPHSAGRTTTRPTRLV